MSATAAATGLFNSATDRRQERRIDGVGRGLFCDLGEDNGGLVLDLSRTGFSLQAIKPVTQRLAHNFGLELPGFGLRAVGTATVIWCEGSRVGFRFAGTCRGVGPLCRKLVIKEEIPDAEVNIAAPDIPAPIAERQSGPQRVELLQSVRQAIEVGQPAVLNPVDGVLLRTEAASRWPSPAALARSRRWHGALGVAAILLVVGVAAYKSRKPASPAPVSFGAPMTVPAPVMASHPAPRDLPQSKAAKPAVTAKQPQKRQPETKGYISSTYKIPGVPLLKASATLAAPALEFSPNASTPAAIFATVAAAAPLPPPKSSGLREGKLMFKVDPVYPEAAGEKAGAVTLQIQVGADGRVKNIRVVRSSDGLFSQAAMAALARWRYAPSVLDGQPVPIEHVVTFAFK